MVGPTDRTYEISLSFSISIVYRKSIERAIRPVAAS